VTDRATLIRAARGPVLLIALGVLFVLDQHTSRLPFFRTWPILIILVGVFRLAEKLGAPPVGGIRA
jgi:hypothetical protein